MNTNPLGKIIKPHDVYDPSLLFPIPREKQRIQNQIKTVFTGHDVWNAYELSWLNKDGKPEVRRAQIIYPSDSMNIVESKSLKLYLNSFYMTRFANEAEIVYMMHKDLTATVKTAGLQIILYPYSQKIKHTTIPQKLLLDNLPVSIDQYETDPGLLRVKESKKTTVKRYSNLLKTNCPITNQPDWGTVHIKYKSSLSIEDAALLQYLISFRKQNDYHESTCEKIFTDLFHVLAPDVLVVKCFYTRRGGIDINPLRYFGVKADEKFDFHYWRQ